MRSLMQDAQMMNNPLGSWTLTGDTTYDPTTGIVDFPDTLPTRTSGAFYRLVPTLGALRLNVSCEIYSDTLAAYAPAAAVGKSSWLINTAYFAADKTTPVANTTGNTGNGNALNEVTGYLPGAWIHKSAAFILGPAISYFTLSWTNNTAWQRAYKIRNPRLYLSMT